MSGQAKHLAQSCRTAHIIGFLVGIAPSLAMAEVHQVTAATYYNTFSHGHPVLARLRPGDTVITKTLDASGKDVQDVDRGKSSNPLTGPFYVEGAEPGDALVVHLQKIRLNRKWGFTAYRLGLFALRPESIEGLYPRGYREGLVPGRPNAVAWDIDLERQVVRLREPLSKAIRLEFRARPMLGCIGVAAPDDSAPDSRISGAYGGNLDYNQVVEGVTVVLPVYHPGAFLFIGDGHALQADGEPTGSGIETSMDVEFMVEVRKNAGLTGPRLETTDFIASVGSQPEFVSSLDRALQLATSDMVTWLVTEYRLEPWAAHLLIGYQGAYDVVTVSGSMALRLPRRVLPSPEPGAH